MAEEAHDVGGFARFDAADYLTSIEHVAAYLTAVLEDEPDDVGALLEALGTVARSQNMSEIARRVGMSREGLYKALTASGNPSFVTVRRVLRALGLEMRFSRAA